MLLKKNSILRLSGYCFFLTLLIMSSAFSSLAQQNPDTSGLHYPVQDRPGDNLSGEYSNIYDLHDPANITDSTVFDPITRTYTIYQKIGTHYYRVPTTYSFEEYWQYRNHQAEVKYFQDRSNTTS